MMAPAAFGRVRSCRFAHAETARAKPMHSKGLWRPDSEEFSAHPEPSRTPAAHARGHPASSRLLCELLDRILAGVHDLPAAWNAPTTDARTKQRLTRLL